jgi:hypothetical protein
MPYDSWTHRTGQPLTPEERLHIGPLAAWDRDNRYPVADAQVEALLPEDMKRRLEEYPSGGSRD